MKVRIKDCHGSLLDLTKGKVYEVIFEYCDGKMGDIIDDVGEKIGIKYVHCAHLNGGSWEIIKENKTMNPDKLSREEAIRAMLDGKKVRGVGYDGYAYYNKNHAKPFRWVFPGEPEEACNKVFTHDEWEIVHEPKKRPMTRNEVLGFLANTSGIVVRYTFEESWKTSGYYSYEYNLHNYEYAYIDSKGNIGEPMKFEVEE